MNGLQRVSTGQTRARCRHPSRGDTAEGMPGRGAVPAAAFGFLTLGPPAGAGRVSHQPDKTGTAPKRAFFESSAATAMRGGDPTHPRAGAACGV